MRVKSRVAADTLTTFGSGAPVSRLLIADAEEDLYQIEPGTPILGFGSNSLLPDLSTRTFLKLGVGFAGWNKVGEPLSNRASLEEEMEVGAGAPLMSLSRLASKQGFSGLEFAGGIPGSFGGAVRMNAGAHGGQISDVVSRVKIFDLESKKTVELDNLEFSYRSSGLSDNQIVVSAVINLSKTSSEETQNIYKKNLFYRSETQPLQARSFGSVFTNPKGEYAGELLERAGMKGYRVGGALFSEMHANWIVKTSDSARTCDVLELIETAKERVADEFSVTLSPEVIVF